MQCIFDYCKADLSGDLLVVAFYAALVLITLVAAFLSRSRVLRTAALLIASAWVLGTLSFFYLKPPAHYVVAIALDATLAFCFWRMAQRRILAAALCLIHLAEIAFITAALSAGLSTWWTLFTLNRLFELTLLYLIGASLFRLHLRRRYANSQAQLTGWRANFIAG
ncbi:MAG: hypothetical protein AB7F91_17980 [Parvularculaceae bacterium]